jgi:hypothetical protein
LIDGKVTDEEKKQMRRYLLKILKQPERTFAPTKDTPEDLKKWEN